MSEFENYFSGYWNGLKSLLVGMRTYPCIFPQRRYGTVSRESSYYAAYSRTPSRHARYASR